MLVRQHKFGDFPWVTGGEAGLGGLSAVIAAALTL